MKKKILMILPLLPFPPKSANQRNMVGAIRLLREMGCDVRLICKLRRGQQADISDFEEKYGIKIFTTPYLSGSSFAGMLARAARPFHWDGESHAYFEKNIQELARRHMDEFKPDYVWVSYTYLWPFRKLAKERKIPFIVRSHNFEPRQLFQEYGGGFLLALKFAPKLMAEWFSVRFSDFVFAISPQEEKIYKILGAKNISVLPSAALPFILKENREIYDKRPLNMLFMGSNYNIPHNAAAAKFLLKDVMPAVERKAPGEFALRVTGERLPDSLKKFLAPNIIYEGFVDNLEEVLEKTDIAVIPSILGGGMQLKIFEPLACGIPTITSPRGLAGYPFKNGEDVLLASNPKEFVDKILMCRNLDFRKKLSQNALVKSKSLFAKNIFWEKTASALNSLYK